MRNKWGHQSNLSFNSSFEAIRQAPLFGHANIPPFAPAHSKEKSLDRSREIKINSYQEIGKNTRTQTQRPIESGSLRELKVFDYKQNGLQKDIESVIKRVRELEGRMLQSEHRVQVLEVSNKNGAQLRSALEEFMRNQYAEIEDREVVKERMDKFQQSLSSISSSKADKKQLEGIEIGRYYGLTQRCNQLQRKAEAVDSEVQQLRGRVEWLIGKLEPSFKAMNQKYVQLFESNVIKTVEHVNRFTEQFKKQIGELNQRQSGISKCIQDMQKERNTALEKENSKGSFTSELVGISLPHIRLIQSISVREEKKSKWGLYNFKEHIKEQHKDTIPLSESGGSTSSSTFNSETFIGSLYDSFDQSPTNAGNELHFEKVIYKLDKDFNLLDEAQHYLLNSLGEHIRLNMGQISLLREHGLIG